MIKLHFSPQLNFTNIIFLNSHSLSQNSKKDLLESLNFKGKYKESCLLPESREVYIGTDLKPISNTFDPYFKINPIQLGANTYKALHKIQNKNISFENIPSLENGNLEKFFEDFTLGFLQASYKFDKYIKKEETRRDLEICFPDKINHTLSQDFEKRIMALNYGINLTRDLINDTPENINPATMPAIIEDQFKNNDKINIKYLDYQKLEESGMNGIAFVGRASRYKPNLVHVTLNPKEEVKHKICLIGKGITYDSGGLDIKTDGHMKAMKSDMGGSATMFGVAWILSKLGLKNTQVHWISAFAENMVDGSSYKADDIITSYSGQTIEVHNTDAEGRLTLADMLSYATLEDPDYIIDGATLTGACIVALSDYFTALMGNDKDLCQKLLSTFIEENELTTLVPMPEVLRDYVKGDISDLINTSKSGIRSGHVTAGLFLSHFVDQNLFRNPDLFISEPKCYKWVHLDIAGSCYNESRNNIGTNGATGQSVKSLVKFIEDLDKVI